MKRKPKVNYKAMFDCDKFRISKFPGKMFLIIGNWRSTRQDGNETQWKHSGKPTHFHYLAEEVVASGRSKKELFESAEEYLRISKMSAEQYLKELIAGNGRCGAAIELIDGEMRQSETMGCKFCADGHYPAVNVNGVIIHRTEPTVVVARIRDEKIVPIEHIYRDGIEPCTRNK